MTPYAQRGQVLPWLADRAADLEWLFGLFRAGQYQGKEVRITGWYRRSPVPFVELKELKVLDGSLPDRRTYSYHAQYFFAGLTAVIGAALTFWIGFAR